MKFSGQYLTYDEYIELGGDLDQTPFNVLEFEARRQIDIRTFNRLKDLDATEIPQEVKMCVFELINDINSYAKVKTTVGNRGSKKSETTDGYSVSYLTATEISGVIASNEAEINRTIEDYLTFVVVNGEHIIYCGVSVC